MSRRTFTRQFRARTGTSPPQWLLERRLARARLLLETTDEPVEAVAHACGFGRRRAATALRRAHGTHRAGAATLRAAV